MTLPISFNPAPVGGGKRITASTIARPEGTAPTAHHQGASKPQLPLSKLTEAARRLAAEGPPFDDLRIAQIRQAIASGQYRTDAAAIADAILRRVPLPSS